jgi:CheY-like chemotaxis protein
MVKRPSVMAPCRLLIVEDDWLISQTIADQLSELSLDVVGIAATVPEALDFLATEDIDAVLLDMKLHERFAGEVAEELQRQGMPFLFVSGYSKALDPRYAHVPILMKPFDMLQLRVALADVLPPQCFPERDNLVPSAA